MQFFLINYTTILKSPQIEPGAKLEVDGNTISKSIYYKYTAVASNLYVPWSIIFPTEDSMYIDKRSGEILYYKNSQPQANFYKFSEISATNEEGLMGIFILVLLIKMVEELLMIKVTRFLG